MNIQMDNDGHVSIYTDGGSFIRRYRGDAPAYTARGVITGHTWAGEFSRGTLAFGPGVTRKTGELYSTSPAMDVSEARRLFDRAQRRLGALEDARYTAQAAGDGKRQLRIEAAAIRLFRRADRYWCALFAQQGAA